MTVTANVWITLGKQAEIQSQIQIGIGNGFTFLNEDQQFEEKIRVRDQIDTFWKSCFCSLFSICNVLGFDFIFAFCIVALIRIRICDIGLRLYRYS